MGLAFPGASRNIGYAEVDGVVLLCAVVCHTVGVFDVDRIPGGEVQSGEQDVESINFVDIDVDAALQLYIALGLRVDGNDVPLVVLHNGIMSNNAYGQLAIGGIVTINAQKPLDQRGQNIACGVFTHIQAAKVQSILHHDGGNPLRVSMITQIGQRVLHRLVDGVAIVVGGVRVLDLFADLMDVGTACGNGVGLHLHLILGNRGFRLGRVFSLASSPRFGGCRAGQAGRNISRSLRPGGLAGRRIVLLLSGRCIVLLLSGRRIVLLLSGRCIVLLLSGRCIVLLLSGRCIVLLLSGRCIVLLLSGRRIVLLLSGRCIVLLLSGRCIVLLLSGRRIVLLLSGRCIVLLLSGRCIVLLLSGRCIVLLLSGRCIVLLLSGRCIVLLLRKHTAFSLGRVASHCHGTEGKKAHYGADKHPQRPSFGSQLHPCFQVHLLLPWVVSMVVQADVTFTACSRCSLCSRCSRCILRFAE